MGEQIRRVVLGPDRDGGATVRWDGPAPAAMSLPAVPGTTLTDIWRSDDVPVSDQGTSR